MLQSVCSEEDRGNTGIHDCGRAFRLTWIETLRWQAWDYFYVRREVCYLGLGSFPV